MSCLFLGLISIYGSLSVLFAPCGAEKTQMSVTYSREENRFEIHNGHVPKAVAWSSYQNDMTSTGWAYLEVYTSGAYENKLQAYAAGLVEGATSRDMISMHWYNTADGYCNQGQTGNATYCQRLKTYLETNLQWVGEMIDKHAKTDPYWHQVELFMNQVNGLEDGYLDFPKSPRHNIDVFGLMLLQVSGDLEDLESALHKDGERKRVLGSGSCSALIKVLPGTEDLYVSQDTWNGYNSMLRILKKYDFSFKQTEDPASKQIAGSVMTFSSYPGVIYSGDDFYLLSSGLATLETTIGNSNATLWSKVKPTNAVLEGIRNTVSNRLATSGKEWIDIFSKFNSGTYNNQWMVVDYTKFKMGKPLQDGLFYVLEQIPGMIVAKDLTDVLRTQTYWASYNSAYFPAIANASGIPAMVKKYGDWFSHDHTPRANIFRRDHSKVTDIDSMTKLMRYNDYTEDPLSRCKCNPPFSAENAISARCDLNPINGTYPFASLGHRAHGGTDMKLTSASLFVDLQFVAVAGPTYDQVPPFQWSKSDFRDSYRHLGHPDLFMFKPIKYEWGSR